MILKNQPGQGVYLFAYDTANDAPKTGDAANITGVISKDGGADAALATTHPTEIGRGRYWQPLSQAETNANALSMAWQSSTADISIDPVSVLTTGVNLPAVAPGQAGGLPTVDGNNRIAGIQGTKNTLDALQDLSAVEIEDAVDAVLLDYDVPTQADLDAAEDAIVTSVAAVKTDTGNLLSNLAALAGKFSGITLLANWLRAAFRADAADATAATEIGGTFASGTDSLQAIRDRGDAEWITGTGGGGGETVGANPVTITVVDDDSGDPLPDALVTIRSAAGTLWGQERTDADGELATSLDDGDWTVSVNPLPGYNGVAGQAFTLPADAAVTVRLAPIAVGNAGSPNLCRVYGYLYLNGEAQEGQTVSAVLAGLPQVTSSVILSGERRSNTTDEAGYWYLDLVRGKTYTFTMEAAGITLRSATVPDQATVDFRTLIV